MKGRWHNVPARIASLLRNFCACSSKNCVTPASFLFWLAIPESTFSKTVFQLICKNLTLSGEMRNFEDFLVATLTFCMFSQNDLLRCKCRGAACMLAMGLTSLPVYKSMVPKYPNRCFKRTCVKRSCCGNCTSMRWSAGAPT